MLDGNWQSSALPLFNSQPLCSLFIVRLMLERRRRILPYFCGRFFLTYSSRLCILNTSKRNVLSLILPILELFLETKFSPGRKAQFEAPGPHSYTYTSAFTYPWQALAPGKLVSAGELVQYDPIRTPLEFLDGKIPSCSALIKFPS